MVEEILLGFDAREMWPATPIPASFLLRNGVERVLSADTLIWPSLFSTPTQWVGANVPFWESLARLESALAEARETRPYRVVAATWHREAGEANPLGPYVVPAQPESRDAGWPLIGYDVTDGSFLSGLSNCGYDDRERPALSIEWGPWLNRSHLFTGVGKALEFRKLSDSRVPEHAPFHIIGLWEILAR